MWLSEAGNASQRCFFSVCRSVSKHCCACWGSYLSTRVVGVSSNPVTTIGALVAAACGVWLLLTSNVGQAFPGNPYSNYCLDLEVWVDDTRNLLSGLALAAITMSFLLVLANAPSLFVRRDSDSDDDGDDNYINGHDDTSQHTESFHVEQICQATVAAAVLSFVVSTTSE